jgi:hypothetical protein
MLQQAGFIFDPNSGTLIDPATQQPMPPDQVAQVLQQIMSQGQQAPAQGDGQPPAGAGAPNGQGDPIIQLLTEIRDAVKGGGKGEGEKSKKQTTEEMMQSLIQELQRTNENLRSLTGQQ